MPEFAAVQQDLYAKLRAYLVANGESALLSQVTFDQAGPPDRDTLDEHLFAVCRETGGTLASIGQGTLGVQTHTVFALLTFQWYVRLGKQQGTERTNALVQKLKNFVNQYRFKGVRQRDPSANDVGPTGPWYQKNFTVEIEFEEARKIA